MPNKDLLFQNLSLTINPYEKVGIVGYSGSGKSSFINLILRLFEVDSGIIRIDDQSIRNVPLNSLRQQISVIPQDLILFHDTILENIRYSNTYATEEEILNAAKMAGLHNFVLKLPNGYKTKVGNNGLALSGGEKQRIIIARILLKNTPILIFDEPTNQLDSITEQEIQVNLLKLMHNKTTLIIAHRLHTIVNMDRILVFDGGKIVQDGNHYELISKPGLYKTLWDTQIDGTLGN